VYKPHYTISNESLNNIAGIEEIRANISHYYLLPEREIEMRYRATVEATHNSTSIEGNPLTLKQVGAVLSGKGLTRHAYAETEVKNYKGALDFIEKRKDDGTPLREDDVFELHGLAMQGLLPNEKIGVFRRDDIFIVDQDDRVKYSGPDAKRVRKLIHDLLGWLDTEGRELHPCLAAAILHYQIVTIHPFSDGNGRMARLMVTLLLGRRDYDFRGAIILDSHYASDKPAYYAALHKCQGESYREDEDITFWIDYFVAGFLSSARILRAEILLLATLAPALEKRHIRRDDADILSYARQFGSISLSEAGDILPEVPRRTLQRKLSGMVRSGMLEVRGTGKNTRYYWRE
jgi:Fic family protein